MPNRILDVTDCGVAADGKTDVTSTLNQCLAQAVTKGCHTVLFPQGTYCINGTLGGDSNQPFRNAGINVPSNISIVMDPECIIKVTPNSSWGYSAFYIGRKENVTITGGQIIGERDEHSYSNVPLRSTHEWGFGICIEGSSNILVENVKISDFTGDGIIISPLGLRTNHDYVTSENVTIRRCDIRQSRRNNISITGCDTVTVEECVIEDAGTGNGTAPKFGIDIEGYGEGDIDYQEALHITIRNNFFNGNAASSITNFNGYGVLIEGNQADNTISYGYGAQTVITGNVLYRTNGGSRTAIAGQGMSQGQESSNAIISNNLITGFSTGIDVRGKSVLVSHNKINQFDNTGISVYQAADVTVEGNVIENGLSQTRRTTGLRATLSENTVFINNSLNQVMDGISISAGNMTVTNNVLKSFSRGIWVTGGDAVIEGNTLSPNGFEGAAESYSISVTNDAKAVMKGNLFRNYKNYPIFSSTASATSIIGNRFESSPLIVTVYLNSGTHEIIDNTITINRTAGSPIGIYLNGSSHSLISGNTINNLSQASASAIQTSSSANTKIIGNKIIKGVIVKHSTDTETGNIII
ncbi:right-handed parallel beta-helix repeat-containing protein [Bacillus nakamurai]|uniref:right-handed parallel beta-helix repeat-containing protein n=1 Tax=Bacillus nakamurai TaxID=1793963 RepID=UPI001E492E85|nr:right-handed parallel beta-helix repeat-containing protein [Bacillus nakamurai]MCC9023446.1 right-handed parallel beta-helix repeat-containing protein [Bacillus nakamurai]